jgi:uncharacterized OsmC-like protein
MTQAAEEELNGLHPEKLKAILQSFEQEDVFKAVSGPWRSRVRWQGGFRAKAYMRTHEIEMDEPTDLDATDMAASAHEQLLSAMGACMTVGFVLNATKRGIKINDLEIAMEGHFDNIRKWAGVDDTGNPGYGDIHAKLFVSADADEATLREIWQMAIDGSPVTQTATRGATLRTDFEAI